MKKKISIVLIAALGLGLIAGLAQAQTGTNDMLMARLEQELARTDEVLQRAREIIGAADNALANLNLAEAVKRQGWAREQYGELQHGFRRELYRMALEETLKAREKAAAAITNYRQKEQYEGIVLRDLERAREMLDQAKELMGETDRPGFRATYEAAERNLVQAWEFYRQGQPRPAYKLAAQVERTARKLLEAANADQRRGGVYDRRHERMQQYLDQAVELTAGCAAEESDPLLERAQQAFRRAEELADNRRYGLALKRLQNARELATRAMRQCRGIEALETRHDMLQSELQRITELADAPSEDVATMLRKAGEQLDLARSFLNEENYESATVALKAAHLLIHQARKIIESTP